MNGDLFCRLSSMSTCFPSFVVACISNYEIFLKKNRSWKTLTSKQQRDPQSCLDDIWDFGT